ncbi:hypothetical protein GCM10011348_16440 [Marinobacterium nitratireducens]|uniref:Uncharacterized protein n=1 Tax=Marinobacterium nitratireducens TaxID=518897 RepID=A0A918DRN1_9GAMM|nr:hypothetical protein [Marinobacterium nitratireducens]GGO80218.1 hypothetical protein GCM10011348_16440 [Marinobacterium nitratireducens]
MREQIANPVHYDPRRNLFYCEQKRFGLRYRRQFVSGEDALLWVRDNAGRCPALEPYMERLNDYHYGLWQRQLEAVERRPVDSRPSRAVWLLHLLAMLLCVPLVMSFAGSGSWRVPSTLLVPFEYFPEPFDGRWLAQLSLPVFWSVLVPALLLALWLSRALVGRIREADLRQGLRAALLWSLLLIYPALYLGLYILLGFWFRAA